MVRTFIGVEVPEKIRKQLGRQIESLHAQFPNVRWVKPDGIHLTIKFIGNLAPDDLRPVFDAVEEAGKKSEPFMLEICGVSALPDLKYPRSIYAGCGEGSDMAQLLNTNIEESFTPLGYLPDKRTYHPHFTLGRVKKPADAAGFIDIADSLREVTFGAMEVHEVVVFMSELKKSGARYTPMQHVELGGF